MLESFLRQERIHGGWRFWVLWVLLTNVGFFAGLMVEYAIFRSFTLALAVPLAAVFQGSVLNRHIVSLIPWTLATAIGWWLGILTAFIAVNLFMPEMNSILRIMVVSGWSGLIVGGLQWLILRAEVKQIGLWWILVSALGWAAMIPGVITGIPLAYFIEYEYRDLVYRAWEKPKSVEDTAASDASKNKSPSSGVSGL